MIIDKPNVEDLDEIIEDARKKNPDWLMAYLRTVSSDLREDPGRYRSYGYYWWVLKRAFLEKGITTFGRDIDKEWEEYMDYGDIEHNVVAADLYQEHIFESCYIYSNTHPYYYKDEESSAKTGDECWEAGEYVLCDTGMEEDYEVQCFFTGQCYDDDE